MSATPPPNATPPGYSTSSCPRQPRRSPLLHSEILHPNTDISPCILYHPPSDPFDPTASSSTALPGQGSSLPMEDVTARRSSKRLRTSNKCAADMDDERASLSSDSSSSHSGMVDNETEAERSQHSEVSAPALAPAAPPPKRKRTRTLTTPHQSAVLHALLAKSRFPTTAVREEVGRQIGLSARKVQIWFQNQRQKARRPKVGGGESSAPLSTPVQLAPGSLPYMGSSVPSTSTAFTPQGGASRAHPPTPLLNQMEPGPSGLSGGSALECRGTLIPSPYQDRRPTSASKWDTSCPPSPKLDIARNELAVHPPGPGTSTRPLISAIPLSPESARLAFASVILPDRPMSPGAGRGGPSFAPGSGSSLTGPITLQPPPQWDQHKLAPRLRPDFSWKAARHHWQSWSTPGESRDDLGMGRPQASVSPSPPLHPLPPAGGPYTTGSATAEGQPILRRRSFSIPSSPPARRAGHAGMASPGSTHRERAAGPAIPPKRPRER